MSWPVIVILILAFIIIYISFIDVFTVLFRMTGLTIEKAKFQVISLFTNAGFTTRESEIIVSNPRRRNLAKAAMITGHIFSIIIFSLIVTIITSIATTQQFLIEQLYVALIAFGVFVLLVVLMKIPAISRLNQGIIEKLAIRSMKRKDHQNVITVLDNYGRASVMEVMINIMPESLKDKTILESNLRANYGIILLLIKRKNKVLDVTADTILQTDDLLVVFGPEQNVKDLFVLKNKEIKEEIIREENRVNELYIMDNYGKEAMVEVHIYKLPEMLKNVPLFETGLKDKYHLNVMMIKRGGVVQEISKDTMFQEGDVAVIFGSYQSIKDVFLKLE